MQRKDLDCIFFRFFLDPLDIPFSEAFISKKSFFRYYKIIPESFHSISCTCLLAGYVFTVHLRRGIYNRKVVLCVYGMELGSWTSEEGSKSTEKRPLICAWRILWRRKIGEVISGFDMLYGVSCNIYVWWHVSTYVAIRIGVNALV